MAQSTNKGSRDQSASINNKPISVDMHLYEFFGTAGLSYDPKEDLK